jgi:beta-lactam-binding protein with PASTA domain
VVRVCFALLAGFLFPILSTAFAQDIGTEGWPEPLRIAGYSSSNFELLLSWREAARFNPEIQVTGYRLSPQSGAASFDVYFDQEGFLLTPENLSRLGIQRKIWSPAAASVQTETPAAKSGSSSSPPTPKSAAENMSPSDMVPLPAIDLGAVLGEDAAEQAQGGKGAVRTGVFQDLTTPANILNGVPNVGTWDVTSDGGHVWAIAVYSPNAVGQRVHFTSLDLPSGAYVIVYDATDPAEVYGPITGPANGQTELWAPTCFSDMVVIECFVPAPANTVDVSLGIDRIVHQYRTLDEVRPKVGSCENDVTCFPGWANEASGVGGIGSIGANGSLFCTGSLLADTDTSTNVPYFLGANHCGFSSNGSAASIEVYWFYQSAVCNGPVPNPALVPRTTGAQFLAATNSSSGTDFVLVKLNSAPPNGVAFLGWSSAVQPLGTPAVGIHHPDGSFKRISFANLTNLRDGGGTQPADRFHETTWREVAASPGHIAVTEPGSSGSPLFNETTHQVIGQLWGGPSACGVPPNMLHDYYGRFDISFPVVAQYLGAPPADIQDIRVTPVSLYFGPSTKTPIFVEIDWMDGNGHSHQPSQQVLDEIKHTFALEGFDIHIDLSNAVPHADVLAINGSPSSSQDMQTLMNQHFNHKNDQRYFYSLWCHNYSFNGGFTGSSGIADLPGRVHIVSLGSFAGSTGTFVNQVGTFVHEFGHNLGQLHGGADEDNFKPNYLSVMNYRYQLDGIDATLDAFAWSTATEGINTFGFSNGLLPSLDEKNLDESLGIGMGSLIDWNCNATFNETGISQFIRTEFWCGTGGGAITMGDFDNWGSIEPYILTAKRLPELPQSRRLVEPCISASEYQSMLDGMTSAQREKLRSSAQRISEGAKSSDGAFIAIYNDGFGPLNVASIAPNPLVSWLTLNPQPPFEVPSKSHQIVQVQMNMANVPFGSSTVHLSINSDDPDEPIYPHGVDLYINRPLVNTSVPTVVGLTQAAAESAIVAAELIVGSVTTASSLTVPAGNVISQNPLSGAQVPEGSAVNIVVSTGPPIPVVPNVVGLSQVAAASAIQAAGLVVGVVTVQIDLVVPEGNVISQNPSVGILLTLGDSVDLVVSSGPPKVSVPDVVGQTQAAAELAIAAGELVTGTIFQQSSQTVPEGSVISQSPLAGAIVVIGTPVDLVLSSGPPKTPVPDVINQTQAAAEAAIVDGGLVVGVVTMEYSDTIPTGNVIGQSPAGDTQVFFNTPVDLVVSLGPAPQWWLYVPFFGDANTTGIDGANADKVATILYVQNLAADDAHLSISYAKPTGENVNPGGVPVNYVLGGHQILAWRPSLDDLAEIQNGEPVPNSLSLNGTVAIRSSRPLAGCVMTYDFVVGDSTNGPNSERDMMIYTMPSGGGQSLYVPHFVDWGPARNQPLLLPPNKNTATFIGVQNIGTSDTFIDVIYHLPTGEDISGISSGLYALSPGNSVGWRPSTRYLDASSEEGPGYFVRDALDRKGGAIILSPFESTKLAGRIQRIDYDRGSVAAYELPSEAVTTLYAPFLSDPGPSINANPGSGVATFLAVQNITESPVDMQVSYYDANGTNRNASTTPYTIKPFASVSWRPFQQFLNPANPLDPNDPAEGTEGRLVPNSLSANGAAYVSANGNIVGQVVVFDNDPNARAIASYTMPGTGVNKLAVPVFLDNGTYHVDNATPSGYATFIGVQNISNADIQIVPTYYDAQGNVITKTPDVDDQVPYTLHPFSTVAWRPYSDPGLNGVVINGEGTGRFVVGSSQPMGSVVVEATGPIVGRVLIYDYYHFGERGIAAYTMPSAEPLAAK